MKILTTLVCLFFGIAATACPDLTGIYYCKDDYGSYQVKYTQKKVDNVTVYTVTHEEGSYDFPADGKNYIEMREDQSGYKEIRETMTSCTADTLTIAYRWIDIDDRGVQIRDNRLNASMSLDSKKNLQMIETYDNESPATIACEHK